MLTLFTLFELKKIQAFFRTKTTAKIITSILFILVFLFVGVGIYFFFINGFRYINASATEDIQEALSLFLYEVFLLLLGGVIVMSALISSLFSMFKGGANNWIMASPSHNIFPHSVLMRSILQALLPSCIIFVPAILAFTTVYTGGLYGVVLIIISILLLIILLTTLTLLLVIIVGYLYYLITQQVEAIPFNFRGLLCGIFVIITSLVVYVGVSITNVDLVKLFRADEVSTSLSTTTIGNHFFVMPTHPFAMELVSIQTNNLSNSLSYFLELFFVTLVTLFLWYYVSRLLYVLWQKLQEGTTSNLAELHTKKGVSRALHIFSGSISTVLFKKEALLSIRNLRSVLWFSFLLCIWLAYVATTHVVGTTVEKNQTDVLSKAALLQALHYSISIYFIAAFTLRFVFPSFSAERKTSWILETAPIAKKTIFLGKYIFFTSFFVLLGLLMSAVDIYLLRISLDQGLYSSGLFIVSVVTIVTFGLTLGMLYPSTDTDDPEAISTSIPGLSFTFIAGIYGALSAYVLYILLTKHVIILFYIFVTVSSLLICMMLSKTFRKITIL